MLICSLPIYYIHINRTFCYIFGSIDGAPSPITLQMLQKYLSLPSEKLDVEAATDTVDDMMSSGIKLSS